MNVRGRHHAPALEMLMAVAALLAACSKAPSSAPPAEKPLPLSRNVEGVTWQAVIVLRDGRSVRKTFKAPAPLAAMSHLGLADTGQTRQLESEIRAWVASTAAGAPAAVGVPSTPRN